MHTIVLAGGYATCLWPITKDRSKMLLTIGDQTVVGTVLDPLEREGFSEDTLVIAGDNLISFDPGEFVDAFEADDTPRLAAYDVGSYERASEYGPLELDDAGRVVDFQEKPNEPTSTLVSITCYGFR